VFEVVRTGPLALLQDGGRPGHAHLGVTASGAADRGSFAAANRLVGNRPGAAAIETVFGGLELRVLRTALVAVTGAPATVFVSRPACGPFGLPAHPVAPLSGTGPSTGDGSTIEAGLTAETGRTAVFAHPTDRSFVVFAGDTLHLGPPDRGLRNYLAVPGGFAAPPTLGSRSTDVLSGLGPPPLAQGMLLETAHDVAAAHASGSWPAADFVRPATHIPPAGEPLRLSVLRGPRDDRFGDAGWRTLLAAAWTTGAASNRVGVRLESPIAVEPLPDGAGELPSEGMVAGAVQVPPNGQPVVFLRDHPVTGGYPVIGVLTEASVDRAAQLRPGDSVRFTASDL
jgi:allophanate hydrolase subunit 2